MSPDTLLASLRGRRLAHYELIEPIGVGGMAAVIRARDTQLDRLVALKILPVQQAEDPASLERFYREARAVARLDHPNIVRAHDIVPAGKTFTVRAPTPQLALEVYMMSLGVLPEDEGFPSSYFGAPDAGTKAEYVLDYRCGGKPDSAMQRLAVFPSGCVDRRGSR